MPTRADAYGNLIVLAVEPGLTAAEGEAFRRAVTEHIKGGGRWFVLDLSKAGAFDSRGLEDLLWLQEQVEEAEGVVKVAGLRGHGRTVFEMVRMDKRFQVFEDVHEAVKSF